jgi:hypothetical protein
MQPVDNRRPPAFLSRRGLSWSEVLGLSKTVANGRDIRALRRVRDLLERKPWFLDES